VTAPILATVPYGATGMARCRAVRASWAGSCLIAAGATGWAMYREVSTFGKPDDPIQTGLDFSNNTWRAVRDLLSGSNIYAPTHEIIPGIGPAWPVGQHVPASLLWQAPFASLPLPAALFAFTGASILAIWAAVFIITSPRQPSAVILTACCGAFAICLGGGPATLLLGQPTDFELLGLAMVMRLKRPWIAGVGFMLAASTLQAAIPLAVAFILLGAWPVVWRGIALASVCSAVPTAWLIANAGASGLGSFISGAGAQLELVSNRIDLGALLLRLGLVNVGAEVAVGLLLAATSLVFLARLPRPLRRIDYPPVLCLVIAFTLLCTYHQSYDMLFVGGCLVPVLLVLDQSRAMLPVFAIGSLAAFLSTYPFGDPLEPLGLLAIGLLSAGVAWRVSAASPEPSTASRTEPDRQPRGHERLPVPSPHLISGTG
jgi:hypothetical protein